MVKNVDPVCEKHETDGAHFAKDGAQQGEKEVDAKKEVEKDKKACVGVVFWNPLDSCHVVAGEEFSFVTLWIVFSVFLGCLRFRDCRR